jgi:hypothetical protein
LQDATNIGSELLIAGKITVAQLQIVQSMIAERLSAGVKTRFGDACRELGFVTDADLAAAEASQARARDTAASSSADMDSAMNVLRGAARASERQTSSRLRALTKA